MIVQPVRRAVVRLIAVLLFAGGFSVASGAAPASACSCVGYTDAEAFAAADVVFIATLVDVRPPTVMLESSDLTRFVFEVDRVFKGRVHRTQSVVTASDGATCGLEISGDGPVLVFARNDAEGALDGELGSDLCAGTRPIGVTVIPVEFGEGLASDDDDAVSDDPPSVPAFLGGTSPVGRDDSGLAIVALAIFVLIAATTVLVYAGRAVARRVNRTGQRG